MLVLRRKVGECILLGEDITISVLAVEGERVKIGVSAPPDVPIVRQELLMRSPQVQTEEPEKGTNPDSCSDSSLPPNEVTLS